MQDQQQMTMPPQALDLLMRAGALVTADTILTGVPNLALLAGAVLMFVAIRPHAHRRPHRG